MSRQIAYDYAKSGQADKALEAAGVQTLVRAYAGQPVDAVAG